MGAAEVRQVRAMAGRDAEAPAAGVRCSWKPWGRVCEIQPLVPRSALRSSLLARLPWIPRDGSAGLGVCVCGAFCARSRAPNVMPLEPVCISSPPPAAVWLAAERLVLRFC